MGLAKSLRKSNYLRPVADAIKNYIRERERVDYLNKLGEGFGDAYRRNKGMIEYGVDPGDSTFTDVPQQTEARGQEGAQFTGEPTTPNIPIEGVQDEVLGDFLDVPERKQRVQGNKMDFLMNALQDPNADMNRIGLMGNMLGQQEKGIKYDADFEGMLKDMESGDYGDKARGLFGNLVEAKQGGASSEDVRGMTNIGKGNLSTYAPGEEKERFLGIRTIEGVKGKAYGTGEGEDEIITKFDDIKKEGKGSGDGSGKEVKSPDYSSSYATVVTGIKEMGRLHKAKPKKDEAGEYYLDDQDYRLNDKEYAKYKEDKKVKYRKAAVQMVKKYDLKKERQLSDEGGAIETIRKDIKKNNIDYKKAIKKFSEKNPHLTDEEKDLLTKYFRIHSM